MADSMNWRARNPGATTKPNDTRKMNKNNAFQSFSTSHNISKPAAGAVRYKQYVILHLHPLVLASLITDNYYAQKRGIPGPHFHTVEGLIAGQQGFVFRCTVTIDPREHITAEGDGKTKKAAERVASLHAVLSLMEHNLLDYKSNKKSNPASKAAGKSGKTQSAKLQNFSLPYMTEDLVRIQSAHLLDRAKAQWIDNPRNILLTYTNVRDIAPPTFQTAEGTIAGQQDNVFRCTAVIDPDMQVIVTGDGKTKKAAERAASLHGVLSLIDLHYLDRNTSLSNSVPRKQTNDSPPTWSDGSAISYERAQEFVDYFCHAGRYGKPEVTITEAHERRKHRDVAKGWQVTVAIAGTEMGQAQAPSKKVAQTNAIIDTARNLEQEDPSAYKTFKTMHKPGMAMGNAPPIYLHVSRRIENAIRDLYDSARRSEMYWKRPRSTVHNGHQQMGTLFQSRDPHPLSKKQHQQKSEQLLSKLKDYENDSKLADLRVQRNTLPVMQKADSLLSEIEKNQVTICMAATGSGKTTQVPQIILDNAIKQHRGSHCNIICTQPRRIAAISVAQRVAKERGESVGESVGYQVRFEHRLPKTNGSITFCTTGVFLRRLQSALTASFGGNKSQESESFLDSVTHVIMDEVHERDVETDLLLVVIKRLLAERKRRGRPEIKLVLMSATVDPTLFRQYFAELSIDQSEAPVVEIPGRSFPVEKRYLEQVYQHLQSLALPSNRGGWVWQEKSVKDYIQREIIKSSSIKNAPSQESLSIDDLELPYPLIALIIADVLANSDDGHVLVFLPGWDEIKKVQQILLDSKTRPLMDLPLHDGQQYEIHVLHSSIPVRDQQAVFEPVHQEGLRRIILATNIAETSITIPDVVYVVDTGRVKEKRYDPERRLSSLVSAWVGTSNLNQRAGRAGRHRPGEYVGVLSRVRYEALPVHQTVEMKRVDLSNVAMHIKALDIPGMSIEDVLEATIEPPSPERVEAAITELERIGAMDSHQSLTSLGKVLQQLPLDVAIGKMCLYGAFFRCLDPVLTLAAILTNRDPFMAPVDLKARANEIKDSFCPIQYRSDAIAVLKAFQQWTQLRSDASSKANRFLSDNMLSRATMMQILEVKQNLFQSLEKARVIDVIRNTTSMPPKYRRRLRETDPEFNLHSESLPLMIALIAVATSPNFAVKATDKAYRTAQDKSCFVHPSSVCSLKFTKQKPDPRFASGRELLAFSEKVRNTSGATSTSQGNAVTFLRGCTRLDPLSYILFGAYEARAAGHGLECDRWLPVTGSYDALEYSERLKEVMDACVIRILEGLGKRKRHNARHSNVQTPSSSNEHSEDEDRFEYLDEDQKEDLLKDRSLSHREIEEFENITTSLVNILDQYTKEFGWETKLS
ncbi:RNA helicase [Malassezia yamatoensis]|uniref:RNA helicase n=1 Tax=Malassezia yamatoensis TaxID=253288 RepID=A0AAJ6CGP0_9BASI|nr:RNA helicase [Malassezia yamatoensis]